MLPECGRGWFINNHAGKRYEDYLISELMPLVCSSNTNQPSTQPGPPPVAPRELHLQQLGLPCPPAHGKYFGLIICHSGAA